ncbi:hypothetical protein J3Q64DRAFT_1634221 [Phycomyces blakesleeanus]
MTLPTNSPNGTIKVPTNFQQAKKSWVHAVLGGSTKISSLIADSTQCTLNTPANNEPGNLTSSTKLPPPVDHFSSQVMWLFLKGTTNHSVVINITTFAVAQKPLFLSNLQTFFNGNEHLWAVTNQICRKYNCLYAEIVVSPLYYSQFKNDAVLILPSFDVPFAVYPTLPPSAKILKISLSELPYQYSCQDGELAQLHADMTNNFSQFDAIVDCGYVTGSSGLYASGG